MTEPALRPHVDGITATAAAKSPELYHSMEGAPAAVAAVALPPASRLTALRIALWGGVGAGVGMMAWRAIFLEEHGPLHWATPHWLGFFLAIGVMLFWKLRIEPVLESRLLAENAADHAHHAGSAKRTVTAALLALFVVVAVEMVVELVHGLLAHNPREFLYTLAAGVLCSGGITWFWVRGTRGTLLRAVLSGSLSALVISYLATILFSAVQSGITDPRVWAALFSAKVSIKIAFNSLEWASIGLAGAIAVHQKWGPRPSLSILVGVALVDLVWIAVLCAWWGRALMVKDQQLMLPFFNFLRANGWGLALYVCPDADAVLDGSSMQQSRRSTPLFRIAVLTAGLLFAVLSIARVQVGLPGPQQSDSAPAKSGHDSHDKP